MKAIDLIRDCATTTNASGGTNVLLRSQVDPKDYNVFKTIAEYAGGVYVNKKSGHSFQTPPDLTLRSLAACAESVDQGRKLNASDYFPTPDRLADALVKMNQVNTREFDWDMFQNEDLGDRPPVTILEPSAGDGALVDAFLRYAGNKEAHLNAKIVMIESDPLRAELLRLKYLGKAVPGVTFDVIEGDFTKISQNDLGGAVDLVLMNPPFKDWAEHYTHASSLLRENGYISAILPKLDFSAQKKGPAANIAMDLMAEAAWGIGIVEENKAGDFNKHDMKRGTAIKTNVATDIFVKTKTADDAISRSQILDNYQIVAASQRAIYTAATQSIEHATKELFDSQNPISAGSIPEIIKGVADYLDSHRHELVCKAMVPIHSSIPMETYAASTVITVAEDRLSPEAYTAVCNLITHGIKRENAPAPSPAPEVTPAPAQERTINDPGQSSFGF